MCFWAAFSYEGQSQRIRRLQVRSREGFWAGIFCRARRALGAYSQSSTLAWAGWVKIRRTNGSRCTVCGQGQSKVQSGPGTTVGIPFAAQVSFRVTF